MIESVKMPKITIEFDLPDEKYEYECFNQSKNMAQFIFEFEEKLRSWYKYGHSFKDMDEMLGGIRQEWYAMKEYNDVREIDE